MNSARAAEISIKDGKPRLRDLLDRKSERTSISRPGADKTAALLRITGVQFTAGARAPVRSSRRNGKVAARRMARFRGVGIACLANVAVIESQ